MGGDHPGAARRRGRRPFGTLEARPAAATDRPSSGAIKGSTPAGVAPRPVARARRECDPRIQDVCSAAPRPAGLAEMYDMTARAYESRGQISEALAMWQRAAANLNDPAIDAYARNEPQGPESTYESLAELQQRWVDRHIHIDPAGRRLHSFHVRGTQYRVGYHCSFMDSDTIRYIMCRAIRAHDRSKVHVLGYAPFDLPDDIKSAFDTVHVRGYRTVRLPRASATLEVDVAGGGGGFSFGHRFGAMARRCAPVQILTSTRTSPAVAVRECRLHLRRRDLHAARSRPPAHFHRNNLPAAWLPAPLRLYGKLWTAGVRALPAVKNGFVTFGCFGSANKINTHDIALWAEVMLKVPGSKILLQHSQLDARTVADTQSPDSRPVRDIAGQNRRACWYDARRHTEGYEEVDISFDTWPCCGDGTGGVAVAGGTGDAHGIDDVRPLWCLAPTGRRPAAADRQQQKRICRPRSRPRLVLDVFRVGGLRSSLRRLLYRERT